jgi:hypothetical protein
LVSNPDDRSLLYSGIASWSVEVEKLHGSMEHGSGKASWFATYAFG